MSSIVSSCTPSVHECEDHVSRSARAEQLTRLSIASFLARILPLSNSFYKDQSNIVGRQPPGCEALNSVEQLLFQLLRPCCGFGADDVLDSLFSEHFALQVFRFGQSVRVRQEYVSRIKLQAGRLVSGELKRSDDHIVRLQFFNLPGRGPIQI